MLKYEDKYLTVYFKHILQEVSSYVRVILMHYILVHTTRLNNISININHTF